MQNTSPQTDLLLTTEQFVDKLQIHPITAVAWRRNGKGPPFISRGGNGEAVFIRYRLSDVEAWLDSARKTAKPETEGQRLMRLRAKAGTTERVEHESDSTPTKAEIAPRRVVKRHVAKPASANREAKRMTAVRAMQKQRGAK